MFSYIAMFNVSPGEGKNNMPMTTGTKVISTKTRITLLLSSSLIASLTVASILLFPQIKKWTPKSTERGLTSINEIRI